MSDARTPDDDGKPAYQSGPPAGGGQPPAYGQGSGQPQGYGSPQPYDGQQGYNPGAVRQGTSPMAIVGFILAFLGVLSVVGLILSIIAFRTAPRDGRPRGLATAGIIIASVVLALTIIGGIIGGIAIAGVAAKCADLGPGTHQVNGVTYTCS
ncbi:hypothetical protein EDF46_1491 [Frondihabitans sp. PhB188]|uniref:DUF4190 domain-containing protein n=1 Tax=Frondihabitans sp. PhB188 TaxID=2485200 RepID=UPI000F48CA2A|nr:DUF4190 domain-containing protein [Frondihabitans sp. PhB188]ROQ39856.1 hypothetical protein EDF46_1491 [Frondihabitans sp. PhB188]